jgi:hypothetical protein
MHAVAQDLSLEVEQVNFVPPARARRRRAHGGSWHLGLVPSNDWPRHQDRPGGARARIVFSSVAVVCGSSRTIPMLYTPAVPSDRCGGDDEGHARSASLRVGSGQHSKLSSSLLHLSRGNSTALQRPRSSRASSVTATETKRSWYTRSK